MDFNINDLGMQEWEMEELKFDEIAVLSDAILGYGNHSCKNGPLHILCNNTSFFIEIYHPINDR